MQQQCDDGSIETNQTTTMAWRKIERWKQLMDKVTLSGQHSINDRILLSTHVLRVATAKFGARPQEMTLVEEQSYGKYNPIACSFWSCVEGGKSCETTFIVMNLLASPKQYRRVRRNEATVCADWLVGRARHAFLAVDREIVPHFFLLPRCSSFLNNLQII
jgi:hypothetical protein